MPAHNNKLRNAKSELGGFTQWLGRKVKNHNPLQKTHRQRTGLTSEFKVGAALDREGVIYYKPGDGRCFRLSIEEIGVDDMPVKVAPILA